MTLDEFKALVEKATPNGGEWHTVHGTDDGRFDFATGPWHDTTMPTYDKWTVVNDASFIAASREMVPRLIAVAEAAEELRRQYAGYLVPQLGVTHDDVAKARVALAAALDALSPASEVTP